MGSLNDVKPTSFNHLIKLIKGIVRRRDVTHKSHESGRILSKIMELVPSTALLMKEHPCHIPVILYHLSTITSQLKLPKSQQCVTISDDSFNKDSYNSCKICNGVCNDVYSNFVDIIANNLVYLSPKGLSHVLSIYSNCKNHNVNVFLSEIKLRMCYFIYCRCKIDYKSANLDDIDSIVRQYAHLLTQYDILSLQKDDYLNNFIKFASVSSEDVLKHSSYYLSLNLMDICVALDSILASKSHNASSPYRTENNNISASDSNNGCFLDDLILKLSFRLLLCHTVNKNDSLDQVSSFNKFELDSVCRLIGLFKCFKCKDGSILTLISGILDENVDNLDFRNLVTLLDAFSTIGDLVSNQYDKLAFGSIVSRIEALCSLDSDDFLRSLSTLTQVMNRINSTYEIPEYERFVQVVKNAFKRYVSSHTAALRGAKATSALAILLNNLQHSDIISLVAELITEDIIAFSAKNLYDYNVILNILIKNYEKCSKYSINHDNSVLTSQGNFINDGCELNSVNGPDLCKIYRSMCSLTYKCSYYYCKILKEALSNSNLKADEYLKQLPLREMCYFLVNVEMFTRLKVVENEFLNNCNINIVDLTANLDHFFRRYHTSLSEMDHYQISNYLSTATI